MSGGKGQEFNRELTAEEGAEFERIQAENKEENDLPKQILEQSA